MSGFLAGMRGRVLGTEPRDSRSRNSPSVPDEPERTPVSEWQAVPPVQRVLSRVSPVVSQHFAASLATHGNPALTGGEPARGAGMPVLEGSERREDFGAGGRIGGGRERIGATSAAVPSSVVRRDSVGSAPTPGGASAGPARTGRPSARTGRPSGQPGRPSGRTAPRLESSTVATAPSWYALPDSTEGTSVPQAASVRRAVARAAAVRSGRSPLLSAPPMRTVRKLAAVGGSSGADRTSASGRARSAAGERPVASEPTRGTSLLTAPPTRPGPPAEAAASRAVTPAVVQRSAARGDVAATRPTHTARAVRPPRNSGSRNAGGADAAAGEPPLPESTGATGSVALTPMTAEPVASDTVVQRSAVTGDASVPDVPLTQGHPNGLPRPTVAQDTVPNSSDTPGPESGPGPGPGLGLGAPLRQRQGGTDARVTSVQRERSTRAHEPRADGAPAVGGSQPPGLGAPLRSGSLDTPEAAEPNTRTVPPAVTSTTPSTSMPTVQRSVPLRPGEASGGRAPARAAGRESPTPRVPLTGTTDVPASLPRPSSVTPLSGAAAAPAMTSGRPVTAEPSPERDRAAEPAVAPAEWTSPAQEPGAAVRHPARSGAGESGRRDDVVPERAGGHAPGEPGDAPVSTPAGVRVQRRTAGNGATAPSDGALVSGAAPGAAVVRPSPAGLAGRSKPQTIRPVASAVMPGVLTTRVQRSTGGTPSPRPTAGYRNVDASGLPGGDRARGQSRSQHHDTNPVGERRFSPPLVRPTVGVTPPMPAVVPSSRRPVVQPLLAPMPPAPAPARAARASGVPLSPSGGKPMSTPGAATPSGLPVTVQRSGEPSRATTPLAPSAGQAAPGARSAAPGAGRMWPSGGARMPTPGATTPPGQARPAAPSPVIAAPSSPVAAAAVVRSAPAVVQRSGEPSRSASEPSRPTSPLAPSAGRASPGARSAVPGTGRTPPTQSAPGHSLPVQRSESKSSVQRSAQVPASPGTPGPSGPVSPPLSPEYLDALARSLLEPLSRLLRSELRGDRERIGRLRDPS